MIRLKRGLKLWMKQLKIFKNNTEESNKSSKCNKMKREGNSEKEYRDFIIKLKRRMIRSQVKNSSKQSNYRVRLKNADLYSRIRWKMIESWKLLDKTIIPDLLKDKNWRKRKLVRWNVSGWITKKNLLRIFTEAWTFDDFT